MVNGKNLHIGIKKNMKTMKSINGTQIFRTTDEKAAELYHNGEANYAPKSEWKEGVRDVDKEVHEHPLGIGFAQKDTKSNRLSKSQKRHIRKTNK